MLAQSRATLYRADGLPSLDAATLSGPIELVKPMLFVCKVPMVYGTIISGIIVFGAVVFVSAMLSSSGPSPSSMASAAALYLPSSPRFTDDCSCCHVVVNTRAAGACLLYVDDLRWWHACGREEHCCGRTVADDV